MSKKILSFEEYAASKNLDSAEEITESCDACGEDPCVCESEEVEDTEEVEDEDEDEQTLESCSEQLKKCYEYAIKEACDYDKDDYPDHTLEGYLKENAALVASLSASALEQAHAELKDDELTIEVYESCLNAMKESYNKKIDELKETWSSN